MVISFPEWTESTNLCGPFTYSMSHNPSVPFINFFTGPNQITVFTNNLYDQDDFDITLTGSIPFPITLSYTFKLHVMEVPNKPPQY